MLERQDTPSLTYLAAVKISRWIALASYIQCICIDNSLCGTFVGIIENMYQKLSSESISIYDPSEIKKQI